MFVNELTNLEIEVKQQQYQEETVGNHWPLYISTNNNIKNKQ